MESGNGIHKFTYEFDIHKAVTNDRLYIYGVASTQDTDRDGETVVMKSLEKAFQKFMRQNPVLIYNHDGRNDAVGRVISEFVGEDGTIYKSGIINSKLYVVAEISKAQSASDVRIQIDEGILSSFSIGGRARKIQKDTKTCVHVSDLHEISIVPIPANSQAMFSIVKAVCTGDNCPVRNTESITEESIDMDKEELVEIIAKTVSEMKAADDYELLQKKYDALKEQKANPEVKTEVPVEKSLAEQVVELKATIDEMKATPIQKGIQDGNAPQKVDKSAMDITSMVIERHYGGT